MCSACASSSPSASNTAAEQSARSLMFGLNAARRSTAPISSATPVSREISTCSAAATGHPTLRSIRPVAHAVPTVDGSRPVARTSEPSGPASPTQPSGTQIVQSSRMTTRGPTTGSVHRPDQPPSTVVDRRRRRRRRDGPQRGHLDRRRPGSGVAVAAPVLGGERGDRRHPELVALAGVAAVERDARRSRIVATPERRRSASIGRASASASSSPAWSAGSGHDRTRSRWRGEVEEADRRQHAGGGRDDHRRHAQRRRRGRRRAAGRRRRTPPARDRAGRRPARPTPPAAPAPCRRRPRDSTPSASTPASRRAPRARRHGRARRGRGTRRRRGCGRRPGSRR